jgi:predicted peptidase
MMSRAVLLCCIIVIICGCGKHPEYSESEFPPRSVSVNGHIYNYRIHVPIGRDPAEKLPVMLYLHGSNRRGDDNSSQLEDIGWAVEGDASYGKFIVVFPQCASETFWAGPMMEQALAALDQTVTELNGDEDRLFLAGYSMGGFGTWQTAVTHPGKFAALVPIAGGVEPVGKVSDEDKALLSPQVRAAASAADPYRAYAAAIGNTPVWVFHGSKDESVPVEGARKIVEALKAAGNPNVRFTELENVGHDSVGYAFTGPDLFEWLSQQRRKDNK